MGIQERIVIIGGGLSGLALAYFLSKKGVESTILEASSRLGGRIETVRGNLNTPLELGATWFSDLHPKLLYLLDELGLEKYKQFSKGRSLFQTKSFEPVQEFHVPEGDGQSYRIRGGTQILTDTLIKKLSVENIKPNTKVIAIKEVGSELKIETVNGDNFIGNKVIICLPPQLAASEIQFTPNLPEPISDILPTVHTWMAGSIKFVIEYGSPFWRENGYSGMLYSHSGIVSEMYDHTNYEENKFGFTGFLNGGAISYAHEERKEFVLRHLGELFGKSALSPTAYFDKVWTDEFILSDNQIIQRPHQNNGHSLLQKSYMHGKLFFSGTESSAEFSGYMEGAITSAESVYKKLLV